MFIRTVIDAVRYIRNKIDVPGRYIQTVRGVYEKNYEGQNQHKSVAKMVVVMSATIFTLLTY